MKDKLIKIGEDIAKLFICGFTIGLGCMAASGVVAYIITTFFN